jgi:hypothetical protein
MSGSKQGVWRMLRICGRAIILAPPVVAALGCSAPPAQDVLAIESNQYELAFDAAVAAAREQGMPPAFRDRRAGVIETEPAVAPSLLEPWRIDGASLDKRVEQTINYERRRTRFEFTPTGFIPPADLPDETLTGPDMLALEAAPRDLTRHEGELELRVRVFVEQARTLGVQRGTWSRRTTSQADIVERIGAARIKLPSRFWTPVARDREFEHRLLAAVQRRLASASPATDEAPD